MVRDTGTGRKEDELAENRPNSGLPSSVSNRRQYDVLFSWLLDIVCIKKYRCM